MRQPMATGVTSLQRCRVYRSPINQVNGLCSLNREDCGRTGCSRPARVHRAPPALMQIRIDLACAVREQRRGARPAEPLFRTNKKPADLAISGLCLTRQRPTFPQPHGGSNMGPGGLNFRVRDGNGWNPSGMATGNSTTNAE